MMYRLVAFLLILTLGLTVAGYAQEGAKPPPSDGDGRIAGEFFAGIAGGTAAAVIPFYLLMSLFPLEPGAGPIGIPAASSEVVTVCAYLWLPVGCAIGSAVGVYLVGNRGNQTGSFTYTLVGASLAGIGCLAAAFLSNSFGFIPLILIAAPAVATIVFNWTRRYKTDAGNSGSTVLGLGQMRF